LALNAIGTNTSNLKYAFPGGFTVAPGATLAVGQNVPVEINVGQTIIDNGTVTLAAGDVVSLDSNCCGAGAIAVNALLSASGTTFNGGGSISVNSGGHLKAATTNFSITAVSFSGSSVLNPGDLTGDTFNTTLSLPYNELPDLAGNASFNLININSGTIS